jgi:hypothetical protein
VSSWRACPRWRDGLELTTPNGASCGSTALFRASCRGLVTAQDDWQHWCDWFGKIRNSMIRLYHDRAIWRTILAMLYASPGVAPGSFGEYRLGSLHRQHPHRHPPGDRCRRRQNRHRVLPRRPAACGLRPSRRSGRAGRLDLLVNKAWGGYEQPKPERTRNGMPRCGSSRWACSMLCSPTGCVRIPPRWHNARRSPAGQPGGDRLGGDPGGQAARVRRGIRDGQGRRRPAGPGRGGAQLREHGVASTAMHPAAVLPRASCNTPTAWT